MDNIPAKYGAIATSDLKALVVEGENDFRFELRQD